MKTDTTPYKLTDEVFFLMKTLGLDTVKDIRGHEALRLALDKAFMAGWNECGRAVIKEVEKYI